MYFNFRKWLHEKGIHYWNRYNVSIHNKFRICHICERWERYDRAKRNWYLALKNSK